MSTEEKKYILNLCQIDLPIDLLEICERLELSISNKAEEGIEYFFQFIDSEEISLTSSAPLLFIGSPKSRIEFFKNNGSAIIEPSQFINPLYKIVVERLLGGNSTLSLDRAYSEAIDSSGQFKITDHLNSGYYCDMLAAHAKGSDFNYLNIRNGFFNLLNFVSLVIDHKSGSFPLEVDFGTSNENFVLQAHFNIENFGAEYLWGSLEEKSEYNFLNQMLEYVDGFDTYILEKTGRLVLTIFWSKEKVESHAPIFIHNIKSFKMINIEEVVGRVSTDSLDHVNGKANILESTKVISEVRDLLSDDQVSDGHLVTVSRITKYLKKHLKKEESLSLENIDSLLTNYPNQEVLGLLSINDKKLIVDSINNNETFENISNSLEEVEKVAPFDDFLDSFLSKVDNLSLEQANEIVTLGGAKEATAKSRLGNWLGQEDENVMVSGSREDLTEHTQVIKGQREDLKEQTQVIKGTREDLSDGNVLIKGSVSDSGNDDELFSRISSTQVESRWSDTKADIAKEIRERINASNTKDISKLSEEVSKVISEKFNIDEQESSSLVKGLFENASEQFITNKDIGPGNGGEIVRARLENEKLTGEISKKDDQLIRMKRIMDNMKKEIITIRAKEAGIIGDESISSNEGGSPEAVSNGELTELRSELESRRKKIEVLENNLKNIQENTKDQSDKLAQEIDSLTVESSIEKDHPVLAAKNVEIVKLEAKLKMANERNQKLNENLEFEKESSNTRLDNDTKKFREKMMKSQELINGFQKDKKDLLIRLSNLEKENHELKEKPSVEPESGSNKDLEKSVKEIETLTKSLKASDDKYRVANLRVKQLEQKNKFLTAKVDQGDKGIKKKNGGLAAKANDAKLNHKIKQLDKMNEKLKESSSRNEKELTKKKKELLQSKQEQNTLNLKIKELERKLLKYEKKAA